MNWDSKYSNFGVVKIEGTSLKVFYTQWDYVTVSVNESISNADWRGNCVVVTLINGQSRRYRNQWDYETI